ncbi:MAG: TIGR01212 family radical SAM protein [Tenericutes bacterium]|nr:TIGR01212 family radical SAM protein [Mycoplasmatota bacterium]
MINKFKYSSDNKKYYTLNYYYRNKYNSKVFKVSLNAGFGCPNKKNGNGCIYCLNGSGENRGMSLTEQFNIVKNTMEKKWKNSKYIGYFQADTNTYAPLSKLKECYESILNIDGVIGLNIATRPDSITDEVYDYLEELSKRTDLVVEIGLQTIHEKTAKLINRGHSLECFNECIKELRKRNINVVVHIINGLPYESKEDMIETIKYVSNLDIQGIKIHMLFILKGTELEKMYNLTHFHVLTKEEYIDIVCDQLEYLREDIVVNRITGDPIKELTIEPKWLFKKFCVLNDIDKEMVRRDSYQGIKYNKNAD